MTHHNTLKTYKTFRQVLGIPDPKHSMPVSNLIMGLNEEQEKQEARPKGPSNFLPANPALKEDLTKWEQDFQNLYLGPVVAAQQVLDLSPRDHLRGKKKKGGGGGGGGSASVTKSSKANIQYLIRLLSYISHIILYCYNVTL